MWDEVMLTEYGLIFTLITSVCRGNMCCHGSGLWLKAPEDLIIKSFCLFSFEHIVS